ncbi:TIGR02301 family protein [Neorhizobium sp. SOG26]|uniref:TIGR02301 family protein n=1 Tax=Neorhizobium sp. SOG26 TaxID=2060726 RepID=UPI000E56FA0B|nr:TIGR02301 family protein [Neorhizobium sp. SOG26]AXV14853.1 TIGR02301 family protein [Neorhizobium sp. SOG26]
MKKIAHITCIALLTLSAATPAGAQSSKQKTATPPPPPPAAPAEEKPAPYDAQLIRLSEVLGSITYLRRLCGAPAAPDWRQSMQQLLDSDTANEPKRRERLTAAFNRGYRTFASVHTSCTDAARTAEDRYRNEGATLATEIAGRFGN